MRRLILLALIVQFGFSPQTSGQQATPASSMSGARTNSAMTLQAYRLLIASTRPASAPQAKKDAPPPPPPIDFRAGDDAFLQVLLLQARSAAARQSLDRLAGWNKAIQPRVENQSISALDVEMLALAEKRAASEAARLESDLRRATTRANALTRRPASSPLIAVVDAPAAGSADGSGLAAMEKDVLVRGRDLLGKMFQSYSVGGVEVAELLWQESRATEAEANYRVWAARAGFDAAAQSAPVSQ